MRRLAQIEFNNSMHKASLFSAVVFLFAAISAQATVTLQFSTASAKLTNIQNAAGTAAGGLRWGIVVDTTNNGFDANGLNYDGFTFPAAGSGLFLSKGDGSATTDDFFYFAATGNTTLASAGGTDSGTNVISQLAGLPLSGGVTAGDQFALIWFDTTTANVGDKYGFYTDPSFVIPNDGNTVNFNSTVLGPDPVRLASNTFGVPEPSRVAFFALGLLGFLARRRR
ncbi:MAG: PEP-CTERM sorting domain-containing protein [Verrucomicrobiaceae bacterium]|nr:PEP-CTERM sorting domain-containing protein [Verrucomicrobiaceae bacterium]